MSSEETLRRDESTEQIIIFIKLPDVLTLRDTLQKWVRASVTLINLFFKKFGHIRSIEIQEEGT